jgi:hypothetical protein
LRRAACALRGGDRSSFRVRSEYLPYQKISFHFYRIQCIRMFVTN